MPSVNDYDANDEDSGGLDDGYTPAQAASIGSATEGPKQAQPKAQSQTSTPGYVAWDSLVGANSDVAQREAGKLQGQVQGDVDTAKKGLDSAQSSFDAGLDANYETAGVKGGTSTLAPTNGNTVSSGHAAAPAPAGMSAVAPGNPWSRHGVDQSVPGANDPYVLTGTVTKEAAANGPTGPQDLEHAAGADAWSQLIGNTKKATDEAGALGSESGVQSLLGQNKTAPVMGADQARADVLDAALVRGAGNKDFDEVSKKYGDDSMKEALIKGQEDSQGRWKQLQSDIAKRQALDSQPKPEPEAAAVTEDAPAPEGVTDEAPADLREMLYGKDGTDFWSTMHQAGLSLSPADWAAFAAGEAGWDSPMPTEEFSKNFDVTGGAIQKSWPAGKFQMAWGVLGKEYPPQAMQSLLQAMKSNPEMLKQYLSMKNPGFMARNMREWLKSAGFEPGTGGLGSSRSEGQVVGATTGEDVSGVDTGTPGVSYGGFADGKTDEDFETRRNQASIDGWLTEFDRQARAGERYPKKPE